MVWSFLSLGMSFLVNMRSLLKEVDVLYLLLDLLKRIWFGFLFKIFIVSVLVFLNVNMWIFVLMFELY